MMTKVMGAAGTAADIMARSKEALRRTYKMKRQAMTEEQSLVMGQALSAGITGLPVFQAAKKVMLYLAMPGEANVDEAVAAALAAGKEVYVPVCTGPHTMEAARLTDLSAVVEGVLRIRIPRPGYETAAPEDLDVVFVPGVAFDWAGGRLGMGAGYYDRFLAALPEERCIGVAWDWQVQAEPLPMAPNDRPMGAVVTNCEIRYF